jgi:hypothetical protein
MLYIFGGYMKKVTRRMIKVNTAFAAQLKQATIAQTPKHANMLSIVKELNVEVPADMQVQRGWFNRVAPVQAGQQRCCYFKGRMFAVTDREINCAEQNFNKVSQVGSVDAVFLFASSFGLFSLIAFVAVLVQRF